MCYYEVCELVKKLVIAIEDIDKIKIPYDVLTYSDVVVNSSLFQGLVSSKGGCIVPGVCNDFEISNDGLEYRFVFGNCRWSNGEIITPESFAQMFRFLLENFEKYTCAENLLVIRRASDFIEGKCEIGEVAIDVKDKVLSISLEYPNRDFLSILASNIYTPTYYDISDNRLFTVTNGPYYLKELNIADGEIIVKRNDYFKADTNVDEIVFKSIYSAEEQECLFQEKKIDITCNTFYQENNDDGVNIVGSNLSYYLNINSSIAFSKCERQELYKKIRNVDWENISIALKNDNSFVTDIEDNHTFIEKVKETKKHRVYKFLYDDYYPNDLVAKKIQELLNNLGMKVELIIIDYKKMPALISKNEYDFLLSIVSPTYSAPSAVLNMFCNSLSSIEIQDKYITLLCDYYESTISDIKMKRNLLELEEILRKELPVIPVCKLNFIYKKQSTINVFEYKMNGTPEYEKIKLYEVNDE